MNWMKVKIILIILFLLINILLVGVIISKQYTNTPYTDGVSEDIKDIMTSIGITVPENLISTKSYSAKTADAYPITSDNSKFLQTLKTKSSLSEKGNYIYNGSEVSFYDSLVHFENSDKSITDAETFFSLMGIDFSNAVLISRDTQDDKFIYNYTETYEDYEIFGAYAKVTVFEGYITGADIIWYEINPNNTRNAKTISNAEALLEFASDKGRGNKPCSVSDITLGYSVDAGGENAAVSQMVPCIRITTDIGSSFYYDARTPEQ